MYKFYLVSTVLFVAMLFAHPAAAQMTTTSGEWIVDVQGLAVGQTNSRASYTIVFTRDYVFGTDRATRASGLLKGAQMGDTYFYSYGNIEFGEACTGPDTMIQNLVVRLNAFDPPHKDVAWLPKIETRMNPGTAMAVFVKIPKGYHYDDGSLVSLDGYNMKPLLTQTWVSPPTVQTVTDTLNPTVLTFKVLSVQSNLYFGRRVWQFSIAADGAAAFKAVQPHGVQKDPEAYIRSFQPIGSPMFPSPDNR